MKQIFSRSVQINIPLGIEIIIDILLIGSICLMLFKAYKALRESIVSRKNLQDQREKNAVYHGALKNYRYFAGLNTTYINTSMPKDSKLGKLYIKYKYQVAVAAISCLTKRPIHRKFSVESDGTRFVSDFFFLVCTGIKGKIYDDGQTYMQVLFEDPFGTVITQPLYDVSYEDAERMVGHFCITEMTYYPDKESARVFAIHVTNLTTEGYVNKKNKPFGPIKQRFTKMWEITEDYNNTQPGQYLSKIFKEDQDERVKELLTLNPEWKVVEH